MSSCSRRTHYTGASISYNLAFTIFGGTAPLMSVFLIEQTGSTIAPAWYVVALSVAALLVNARMTETSRRSMLPDASRPTPTAPRKERRKHHEHRRTRT
ncbi:hypothetical protein ACFVT2_13700 [Streptomyces sp. NPDC058000]|uniref:hypothetical protein n=1 Tax=Streptomyces sp. NPDC058000 TaxID=3346299 RepID=UPI0036EE32D2